MSKELSHTAILFLLIATLASCGGGGSDSAGGGTNPTPNPSPTPTPTPVVYTVGGSISGLTGSGLVLQNNLADNLTVASGSTAFTFATSLADGAPYSTTVLMQPNNPTQNCVVSNGSGAIGAANVGNISIACTTPTPPSASNTSSYDLIDAALAAGNIDAETALVYKVYATFGDSRLPAEYAGNLDGIIDTPIMDEVIAQFESLSASAQQALGPFLLRPNIQGSWGDPAGPAASATSTNSRKYAMNVTTNARPPCQLLNSSDWGYLDPTDVPVRIWYRTADSAKANELATELTTNIWKAFVALHGVGAPLPVDDTNSGPTYCYGGDAKLDIYLVDMPGNDLALTVPEGSPNGGPVYILMKRDHANIGPATAHEIMHAVQWAVTTPATQDSYGWVRDALANWAIDMVYGKNSNYQFEQSYADCFMNDPQLSLDDRSSGHCKAHQPATVNRDYGAYLYIQYLVDAGGGNAIAAQILNSMAHTSTGLKAVDAVSPFKDHWPVFAKLLWNQDPDNVKSGLDSFDKWDSLTDKAQTFTHTQIALNLNGQPSATATLNGNIKHLATHYYAFQVTDPNVRSLVFYNHPYAVASVGSYKVSTQAFLKIGGVWDYAHWSQNGSKDEAKSYCLDAKAERIEELAIVMSNDSIDQDITDLPVPPRLSISDVGCWEYKGTTSVQDTPVTSAQNVSSTTTTKDVVFKNVRYINSPAVASTDPGHEHFQLLSGAVNGVDVEVQSSGCTLALNTKNNTDATGDAAIPPGVASGTLFVDLGLTDTNDINSRAVSGSGQSPQLTHRVLTCSGVTLSDGDETDNWSWLAFPQFSEMQVVVEPDGSINNQYTHKYTDPVTGSRIMIWNLQPQREP